MRPIAKPTHSRGWAPVASPVQCSFMSRPRAFTLVELLLVISLITLLIGMLLPAIGSSRRSARNAIDLSNQRQIINAVLSYSNDHDQKLPMSGRSWPHMGMLDFYEGCLRPYLGDDMTVLHCPRDVASPGGIANWWRAWYGTPMTAADHKYLKATEPGEVNYSYGWSVKMYWAVDPTTGVMKGNNITQQFRVESVRNPSQLMTHRCFANHGDVEGEFSGMNGAFIDMHAEWVRRDRIIPSGAPWYGTYNLDWTLWGIAGRDVE